MRAHLTKILAVVLLAAAPVAASAQEEYHVRQVEIWYERYLGRAAEPAGLVLHAQLLCSQPANVVEAHILASPEYVARVGGNDIAFLTALYRDALGIPTTPQAMHHEVAHLRSAPSLHAFVVEFLNEHRGGAAPQAPVAVETYRPAYAAPVVVPVYQPVVRPIPVYRPVPVPVYRPVPVFVPGHHRPIGPPPGVTVGVRNPNFAFGLNVR